MVITCVTSGNTSACDMVPTLATRVQHITCLQVYHANNNENCYCSHSLPWQPLYTSSHCIHLGTWFRLWPLESITCGPTSQLSSPLFLLFATRPVPNFVFIRPAVLELKHADKLTGVWTNRRTYGCD